MKQNASIELDSLVKMLESEIDAEKYKYFSETGALLGQICESADALGPITLEDETSSAKLTKLKFTGSFYYSRFKSGDRVEIRIKRKNSDYSDKYSYNWIVEKVLYPSPGKLEIIISSQMPVEMDKTKEYFLFNSLNSQFNKTFIKKIVDMKSKTNRIILGKDIYNLDYKNPKFKELYRKLNMSQKGAVDYLIDHNLNGAIQGPPGTGKTQLLQAVVSLALQSNMKVCIASFTNAAVDNLLGRVIGGKFEHDWLRVGNLERVRSELYPNDIDLSSFVSTSFGSTVVEANLFGATLHKLALNARVPNVDLLLIDEAGQVPIYFWPFIQRMAKRVVLVGDQFQLPPVLKEDHCSLPFNNVFSLVVGNETPMLETQYRMRREIQAWSSEKFYRNKLVPHHSVAERDYFDGSSIFLGDGFVAPKKFESNGSDSSSLYEANFITDKISKLIRNNFDLNSVGVICPYRFQAGAVNASLQNRFGVVEASKVMVDTVERFQGQEKEAIFLSLGVSGFKQGQLSFLSNPKRLNVSVTRAKSRFYCLFSENLWERSQSPQSEDLNEFLRWVTDGSVRIKRAA